MSNRGQKINFGPVHNNANLTCAIDIRVGGSDPNCSDLLEVAFLPLDAKYKLHTEFKPFQLKMRPSWPVDKKVAKLNATNIKDYETSPFDQIGGQGLFTRWADSLELRTRKKIIPLVWDWAKVQPYLKMWLGDLTFEHYIFKNSRDLMTVINFINDRGDYWGDEIPFKILKRTNMFTRLNVQLIDENSVVANALAMIESYNLMLRGYIAGYAPK